MLLLRLLRYRVALMLWLFLLLGSARETTLGELVWDLPWAILALASSYVAATSINDVADREIDRVNHPGDRGRPLVTGEGTRHELLIVHGVAVVLALAAAAPLGRGGLAVVGSSLVIGWIYSAGPVRISYRTYLAPLVLSIAYVIAPYTLGVWIADGRWGWRDATFVAALAALFLSRITLKDFRDRPGDAMYGRPTMLLRLGKGATCSVSLVALTIGGILLTIALEPPPALAFIVWAFLAAIAFRLRALWLTADPREEQLAIGLGARMGNGLLIALLGWFLLAAEGVPAAERLIVVVAIGAVSWAGYLAVLREPDRAVIAYKG